MRRSCHRPIDLNTITTTYSNWNQATKIPPRTGHTQRELLLENKISHPTHSHCLFSMVTKHRTRGCHCTTRYLFCQPMTSIKWNRANSRRTLKMLTQVGAKVLLLKNIDTGNHLVNGSTGVVLKLEGSSRQRFAVVEFDVLEGKATSVVRQEEWTITMGDR